MAAPKKPGIQIKLVSHQTSLTLPSEEKDTQQDQTEEPEIERPEEIEETEEQQSVEKKEAIVTKSSQKVIQKEPSETKKERQIKPPKPPASVTSLPIQGVPEDQLSASESNNNDSDEFQQWTAQLQYRINRNKTYPYQAKRRRLEGEVKMEAEINPDGTLAKARMLAGKKAFETSSLKAIERSLPLPPPNKKSVTVIFSIHYRLL